MSCKFTAMVEGGIPLARSIFAFNSVNVEGWALNAEAEMVPYEPLDGQLIALQFRLLRAARAILDPMLNLGLIDRERARLVLENDVGLSPAMARQELDRYMVRAPGQAGSYCYGYSRIPELRMRTELALGPKFDRLKFNNFLLDQGLLPPDQLAKAVEEQFIPRSWASWPPRRRAEMTWAPRWRRLIGESFSALVPVSAPARVAAVIAVASWCPAAPRWRRRPHASAWSGMPMPTPPATLDPSCRRRSIPRRASPASRRPRRPRRWRRAWLLPA